MIEKTEHMKKAAAAYMFLVILLSAALSGCIKEESYPIIPEIEFLGFVKVYDTGQYAIRGILTISFQDGDGDIGLYDSDTLPPYDKNGQYYYNYVIEYFEKQNGIFVKRELDPSFSARIPYLTPEGATKAIKGVIVDTLPMDPTPVYDTVRFRFFIYDRALHASNADSTPPIILRRR